VRKKQLFSQQLRALRGMPHAARDAGGADRRASPASARERSRAARFENIDANFFAFLSTCAFDELPKNLCII
jgi:hypothetical protein